MIAVAALAIGGVCRAVPRLASDAAFVFLGVSMGAGISPEIFDGIVRWPISIAILILIQPLVIGLIALYLTRFAGWTPATALFSAIPGALSYVVALADQSGADMRKVAITQSMRLFILVALMPSIITAIPSSSPSSAISAAPGIIPALVQLAAGTAGALVFIRLNVPAAPLLGAFFASAVLHGAGVVHGSLPDYLLVPGLVIIGAVIGSRFAGTALREIASILKPALFAFLIAVSLNAAAAFTVAATLHLPTAQTLLAFAPGGLDAMTVVAFALALDPAFVAAHHVARFVMMIVFLPVLARAFLRREKP